MNTEINLNEPFGYEIYQTTVKHDLRRNLEIGSWDGEGSTTCFVEAMKLLSGDRELQCVEVVPDKLTALSHRFRDTGFVKCFLGSSVSMEDMLYRDFETVWNSPYNMIRRDLYSKELVRTWFDRDMECVRNSVSFLGPDTPSYDGVLIDGGEFTGFTEFSLIRDKTRVLFLDDVHHAFKCYEIYRTLREDSSWTLLSENPHVRNGYAIFLNNG